MKGNATAKKIGKMTGARTRITWVQQIKGCSDFIANESDFMLMGFDTDDGKGARPILKKGSLCMPDDHAD